MCPLHLGFTIPNAACWQESSACSGRCWLAAALRRLRRPHLMPSRKCWPRPNPRRPSTSPSCATVATRWSSWHPERRNAICCCRPSTCPCPKMPAPPSAMAAACAQAQRLQPVPDGARGNRATRCCRRRTWTSPAPHDCAMLLTLVGLAWELHADVTVPRIASERSADSAVIEPASELPAAEVVRDVLLEPFGFEASHESAPQSAPGARPPSWDASLLWFADRLSVFVALDRP